jgi:hypothetical protein
MTRVKMASQRHSTLEPESLEMDFWLVKCATGLVGDVPVDVHP